MKTSSQTRKKMKEIIYKPIGIIHSPYTQPKGTPIQPTASKGNTAVIDLFPEYKEGLKDLNGFSHLILIYHFHLSKKSRLQQKPFMDEKKHGIFAMRGPSRPNPIGFSIVRLIQIKENKLTIADVDILDGTPLLDIKPYVPEFDQRTKTRIGWLSDNIKKLQQTTDDGRFQNTT